MAGATVRIPMSHRILNCYNSEIECCSGPPMSLSDTVFGFLDVESEGSPESVCREEEYVENEGEDGDEEREKLENSEDNKNFWETQQQILHGTLGRTSSLETKIRNVTKEVIKNTQMVGNVCGCRRPVVGGCRNCLMREVCGSLQNAGFDSAICKSKWRNSPDIPSGEHTFLDVVDKSSSKKGEVRVIVELNFRAEFEMARSSEEYNKLINRLPEIFVGKVERLQALIKVLCSAAKKCMKEKKMHMGPWRKHRYMQAKWLGTCERKAPEQSQLTENSSRPRPPPPPRPRASMLTVDLFENFSNMHRTIVGVV